MATGNAKRFVELGLAVPLAKELAAQITAGTGDRRRLVELGMMPGEARRVATAIGGGTVANDRLAETGMVPRIIRELKAQIGSSVPPSTVSYAASQIAPGWAGTTDTTTLAGKVRLQANLGGSYAPAALFLQIKGTAAAILLYQNTNSTPAGMVEVSVDGAAYAAAPVVSGKYQLFTGLSDTTHTVMVRINVAYGLSANMPTTGNVLDVTGAPPSVTAFGSWRQVNDANTDKVQGHALITNPSGASNILPAQLRSVGVTSVNEQIVGEVVRGDFTTLVVVSYNRYISVAIGAAAPTMYDLGTVLPAAKVITGLSGTQTYTVCGSNPGQENLLAVGGILSTGYTNITPKKRFHQYGTSITNAVSTNTSAVYGDVVNVAGRLGRAPANYGVAGNTVAQIKTRITATLAALTGIGANDVAVLEAGRNDVTSGGGGDSFSAGVVSDYTDCVNQLLAAGYGLIICRGITPGSWPGCNSQIASIVSGIANPKVVYVDTAGWTGIATGDGVHPTDAGYVTLSNYAVPAYLAVGA